MGTGRNQIHVINVQELEIQTSGVVETANGTAGSKNVKKKKLPKMILAFDSFGIFVHLHSTQRYRTIAKERKKVLLLYSYIILMYVAISFQIRK